MRYERRERRRRPWVRWLVVGLAALAVVPILLLLTEPRSAPTPPRLATELRTSLNPSPGTLGNSAENLDALAAEAASLRAGIAAERARLEALTEVRENLMATIAELEQEVETRRTELAALQAAASQASAEARQPKAESAPLSAPPEDRIASLPLPPRFAPQPTAEPRREVVPRREAEARQEPEPPPAGGLRVAVHHRAGSRRAVDAATTAAAAVRDAGFEVQDIRGVTVVPGGRIVRYFHDSDATAAARLAGRLGPGWAIQDSRASGEERAPGTVEIWLPDR